MTPINSVPNNGYNKTGLIPSSDCGKNEKTLRKPNTKYPAINPASKAPKNPAVSYTHLTLPTKA